MEVKRSGRDTESVRSQPSLVKLGGFISEGDTPGPRTKKICEVKQTLYRLFFKPTDQALTEELKKNRAYPFRQVNSVFVLSYLHGNLWRGLLLLTACVATGLYIQQHLKDHLLIGGLVILCTLVALWLVCNGAFRRLLVIDPEREEYRFYVHSLLMHKGPLHQIYVRMVAQTFAPGKHMYKLIVKGCRTDVYEISGFSEKYELIQRQGWILAQTLQLNFFDYKDASTSHRVIHCANRDQPTESEKVV